MKILISAITIFFSTNLWAQNDIEFSTKKLWDSGRWYLIGSTQGNKIKWLNGGTTVLKASSSTPACLASLRNSETFENNSTEGVLEVLRNKLGWIAVELDPSKKFAKLNLKVASDCEFIANLKWELSSAGRSRALNPYLFLRPENNQFSGRNIEFEEPFRSSSADIVMDILIGGGMLSAENDSSESLSGYPIFVTARGEWSPPGFGGFGFELQMTQSARVFGNDDISDLFVSDWLAGAYYQHVLQMSQGLVLRATVDYIEHLADRGANTSSANAIDLKMLGLNLGFTTVLYFQKKWQWLTRFDYMLPNRASGAGVSQSYFGLRSHIGYLLTDSVFLIAEGGMKQFSADSNITNTVYFVNSGVRLEL